MPRLLTQHTLACLTRQGAEALAQRMQAGGTARAERVLVNMLEGKMFVEFRADSREALEGWLKTEGMHFDFLVPHRVEMQGDKLQRRLKQGASDWFRRCFRYNLFRLLAS